MFKGTPITTSVQEGYTEFESKYKVAEILSSMQSSTGLTPITDIGGNYVTTTSAPLFTPTTVANIEQAIINLSAPSTSSINRESGFVPPIVDPNSQMPVMVQIKSEQVDYDTDYSSFGSESEYGGPAAKRGRYDAKKMSIPDIDPNTYLVANSRRPTGPRKMKKDQSLSHEEVEKRTQRRERNKHAAAKCRKRREDVTNTLILETETLEDEKNHLENEIYSLRQQKEQFEFLLEAHKNTCQHKHALNLTAPPKTTATMTAYQAAIMCRPETVLSRSTVSGATVSTARPNSLPISSTGARLVNVSEALGIPISTPSAGMFGFDAMADGHTGLTPLTGIASSTIATPVATSTITCSGQVQNMQRRSTDSSSSNDLASPTTLMAL